MSKDRAKGTAHQVRGAVKEKAGKLTGDKRVQVEGKGEKLGGKVRNTAGRIMDALRGK